MRADVTAADPMAADVFWRQFNSRRASVGQVRVTVPLGTSPLDIIAAAEKATGIGLTRRASTTGVFEIQTDEGIWSASDGRALVSFDPKRGQRLRAEAAFKTWRALEQEEGEPVRLSERVLRHLQQTMTKRPPPRFSASFVRFFFAEQRAALLAVLAPLDAARTPLDELSEGQRQAFHRALHHHQGAEERWAALRRRGATDEELRAALGYEFGTWGSSSGPGMIAETHKGRRNPELEIGTRPDVLAFKGATLLRMVRAYFQIPKSVAAPTAAPAAAVPAPRAAPRRPAGAASGRAAAAWTPASIGKAAKIHAVDVRALGKQGNARCTVRPTYKSSGWTRRPGAAVTCAQCLASLGQEPPGMDHPDTMPTPKTALRLALEAILVDLGRSAAGLTDEELQAAAGWLPPTRRAGVVPFEPFLEDRAPLLREWLPRGYPVTLEKEGHPAVVLRAPKDRFKVGAEVLGLRVTAVGRRLEPTTAADVLRWALILWHKLPDDDNLKRLGAEWGYQEARAGAPRLDDQGLAMELARIDGGSVERLGLFRAGYARGWAAAEAGG